METKFKTLTEARVKNLSTIPPWLYDLFCQVIKPSATRLVTWVDEMKDAKRLDGSGIDQQENICYNNGNK